MAVGVMVYGHWVGIFRCEICYLRVGVCFGLELVLGVRGLVAHGRG
jgi:hypothetical protein